ncbi:hypothetical protein GALMADRAFT_143192 [Galerina marginata CBS 339.88]|uniref:Uncharacterized protein n=1 Tax=Galerina marginata (strain CBS 339.88) TaxID=685588 RepID=A0A067SN47_GALM3|nr:hypothetical protein GALMADRAFT_143192 [Galerina marginata CBS 339.88]
MFTLLLSLIALVAAVQAQVANITVADTDPSIVYAGNGTGPAAVCQFNAGTLSGPPGCYFFPTNCTSSAAISQNLDHKATATFKFNGSAIYINSALTDVSPVYTVTLDGQSTDVDGVRPSVSFTCASLFSQTGLSTTNEHTVTLSVKGPSPNRNMTEDPAGVLEVFSLIDFM